MKSFQCLASRVFPKASILTRGVWDEFPYGRGTIARPATGLWSKQPVRTPADFRALSIRAYGYNSAQVMRSAGAEAAYMPFGEAIPKLRAGSLNAVLSSDTQNAKSP